MREQFSWAEFSGEEPISLGRQPPGVPAVTRPQVELDPVEAYIIYRAMFSACEQMDITLRHTAYSTIMNVGKDYSCGVFTADARLVAQACNCAVHLASMHYSVEACVREFGIEQLAQGDLLAVSDPYRGGTHLPDLTIVRPIFHRDELVMFAASRAHHIDVGGSSPGSFPMSEEIFSEGIRIPPVKYYTRDRVNRGVMELVLANVRVPKEYWGDVEAQLAADRIGERHLEALFEKHGRDKVMAAVLDYMDHTERGLRAELAKFPDGTYAATDYMDGDGIVVDPYKVYVEVTIDGTDVYCDFTGTDAQARGPINAVFAVTASSVINAFLSLTNPNLMPNHGFYRPLHVKVPEGTMLNPRFPAPVVLGNTNTSQRIIELIWQAMAPVLPESTIGGPYGAANDLHCGGFHPETGERYVYYWSLPGGWGARATKDGWHVTITEIANNLDIPVEVFEYRYPWLIHEYGLRNNSGGPGKFRGGCGASWKASPRGHDAVFSLTTERVVHPPWGAFGGMPGATGKFYVYRGDGETEHLAPKTGKISHVPIGTADTVHMLTQGGGGYGNPLERDPARVLKDVTTEIITNESARADYGVVIDTETLTVDQDATVKLRGEKMERYKMLFPDLLPVVTEQYQLE